MSYPSTIAWFHKTFTTRQRTTDLFRPELEDHVISLHDYELATRFLPGPSMDWHITYGAGTSAAVYGYGSYFARPRWNTWRLRLGSVAAFFVGSTYGTFRQLILHYRFANSLENPQGFIVALNHIDERLGGAGRMGFAFRDMLSKKPEVLPDLDHTGHAQDAKMVTEEGWVPDQDSSASDVSNELDPAQFRTRWDEIRVANLRTTGQSSWDAIRQRHERTKLPDSTAARRNNSDTQVDERAAAQAEFDALLDAERRKGQSQDDRE